MANRKTAASKSRAKEETCLIPASILNVPLPRNLDLASFVDARMTELNHFLDILNDKVKGRMSTKRNFQLLPKHMRRRAMSHNAHRVPARIRTANQEIAYLKNPCRKSRRHCLKLMQEYTKRSAKAMWLETHIWHAKRMKMAEKWGYKLAFKSNDKSIRATYRFSRDSAVIYDQSYQVFVLISDVEKFFSSFSLKPKENFRKRENLVVDSKLIATVEVYLKDSQLVVSVHPAAFEEFSAILNDLQIQYASFKDQVTMFKLRGPRSTEFLAASLDLKNDQIANLLNQAAKFQNFHFLDGSLLCADVIKSLNFSRNSLHDQLKSPGNLIPEQPGLDLLAQVRNHQGQFYDPSFWNSFDPEAKVEVRVPEKITTRSARSRYPGSRKVVKPAGGQPSIPEENSNVAGTKDVEMSEISENSLFHQSPKHLLQSGKVLLVYHKSKHGSGWDLILKEGSNNNIWRSLVFSGCKAVGLQEFKSIAFESAELFFPNDFPTSQSYEQFSNDRAKDEILKYFKRPSSKRVNFERIKSPFPFYSSWHLRNPSRGFAELVPVKVKCFNRCPKDLAYICKAEENDLKTRKVKETQGERTEKNSSWKPEHLLKLETLETCRPIIGFVTTGGFSFRKCKGFGIGHIFKESLKNFPSQVLFRNPSSQFYHVCELNLLKR